MSTASSFYLGHCSLCRFSWIDCATLSAGKSTPLTQSKLAEEYWFGEKELKEDSSSKGEAAASEAEQQEQQQTTQQGEEGTDAVNSAQDAQEPQEGGSEQGGVGSEQGSTDSSDRGEVVEADAVIAPEGQQAFPSVAEEYEKAESEASGADSSSAIGSSENSSVGNVRSDDSESSERSGDWGLMDLRGLGSKEIEAAVARSVNNSGSSEGASSDTNNEASSSGAGNGGSDESKGNGRREGSLVEAREREEEAGPELSRLPAEAEMEGRDAFVLRIPR